MHDPNPAAELLHGDEVVVYADAGYQGIAKRAEMAGMATTSRVAMRPGKRRVLRDTADGRFLDLIETAKTRIRAKGEHPFRMIKQKFSFKKTRLRGLAKNRCKIHVLAALTNLFITRRRLLLLLRRSLRLGVDVDRVAGLCPLVAAHWLGRLQVLESAEPQALEHRAHSGERCRQHTGHSSERAALMAEVHSSLQLLWIERPPLAAANTASIHQCSRTA